LPTEPGRAMGRGRRRGDAMHAQVITFGLNGITEEQVREACGADTPTFANLPALLAKNWLRNPETNTYGGLYLWDDQEAYERYIRGEVFNAIRADQNLKNVESRDFGEIGRASCRERVVMRAGAGDGG